VTLKAETKAEDALHWTAVEEAVELLHEERHREALVELRSALRADAKNPYAYFFLGVAFFETGEIAAARDAHTACLRLAPEHLGARVALCHVLRILGDLRGAVRQGMTALSQAPGDADALYALGLAHHARGDDGAATAYLDAFLETQPEFDVAVQVRELLATINPAREATEDPSD
jgi:tetratricopeptide (TPR) repeat protein